MKYLLYDELLDPNNILSHVFMSCASDFIKDIAEENDGKTDEEIEARTISIEVKINGKDTDPKKFFELLYGQYTEHVRKAAQIIVDENISDKFKRISDIAYEAEEIAKSWSESINWEIPNPFNKEE